MDFSLKTIRKFWRLFEFEGTEIIITNISKELRTAGIAARLKGVVHINCLGAFGNLKMTLKTRLLYSLFVDKVFVPSQSMFDFFAKQNFLRPKLQMFYNAIEVPPLNIMQNPTVKFAIVAKLSKVKQVDKVIRVFGRLQDVAWELHIGGFGPDLEQLQTLTRELHLEGRIHFTGKKIDPYEFLKDKDVGILYSRTEAFGIAIIEYMALSCAVIASNVGGIPEIIRHNVDGLLIDPQNLDDLEHAIRLLISNPQRRETLIRKGHEKVQTQFNRNIIFARIEEELQQILTAP